MRRLWWALMRFMFRLLYNELAWTYDLVAWMVSLGQWRAWGRAAIPHLRGERVLELAHGPGHLLLAMAERDLTPVGLDLSPHMGRLAGRRLRGTGRTVPLVRARAQALPFCDGCFDSAVATFPTGFILDLATMHEAARVLRDSECNRSASPEAEGRMGGELVVVAWARLDGSDLISRFIRWLYQVTGEGQLRPDRLGHVMAEAGFVPRVIWKCIGRSVVMLVVAKRR